MGGETSGPGRRLTPDEERRGAELFAAGKSERQVAAELGIGTGSANRLRKRLAARQEAAGQDEAEAAPEITGPQPSDGPPVLLMTAPDTGRAEADRAAELAELETQRAALAEVVRTHEERAEASRTAVTQLELERREVLRAGRDAAPLRSRLAAARADADDSSVAADLARERLVPLDARIAELTARQELGRFRAELADAVTDRDAVFSRTGDRQRAAILAIRDAAVDYVATFTDEQDAFARVERLAATVAQRAADLGEPGPAVPPATSTMLTVSPHEAHAGSGLALTRAMYAARAGRPGEVASLLGQVFGWLPRPAESWAAEAQVMRERQAAAQAEQARAAQPGTPALPGYFPATVGLDDQGRPVAPDPVRPEHVPMPPNRHPSGIPFWPR